MAAIVAANLLPLAGVLFWGWKAGDVVWLYWFENLVVGAMNVLRMALAQPPAETRQADGKVVKVPPVVAQVLKLALIAFFVVHYSGFCFVHGVFVSLLFPIAQDTAGDGLRLLASLRTLLAEPLGAFAALAIVAGHAVAFVRDEIVRRPAAPRPVEWLMLMPYPRVVAIHVFLMGGGLLIQLMNSPLAALALFVAVKIVLDATLYGLQQWLTGEKKA